MLKRSAPLLHGDLTERIIGVYHEAHHEFGDGFLEALCQRVMVIALQDAGLTVRQDMKFEVKFRGHSIGTFVPDLVVNELVLVEIKSVPSLEPRHVAQAINYLRASTLEVALLLNFGPKREVERLIFTNDRKQMPGPPPSQTV
jgi:GxxExxY protein